MLSDVLLPLQGTPLHDDSLSVNQILFFSQHPQIAEKIKDKIK